MFKMLKSDDKQPTAAEIAETVRRGPDLQLAERTWRALHEKRDAVVSEKLDLIRANEGHRHDKRIMELDAEERDLTRQIGQHKAKLDELRAARAVKVEEALADRRRVAADGVLEALETLRLHLNEMEDCQHAIERAGGPKRYIPTMRVTEQIERIALKYRGKQ